MNTVQINAFIKSDYLSKKVCIPEIKFFGFVLKKSRIVTKRFFGDYSLENGDDIPGDIVACRIFQSQTTLLGIVRGVYSGEPVTMVSAEGVCDLKIRSKIVSFDFDENLEGSPLVTLNYRFRGTIEKPVIKLVDSVKITFRNNEQYKEYVNTTPVNFGQSKDEDEDDDLFAFGVGVVVGSIFF